MLSYMQEIVRFTVSEQNIFNFFKKDLVMKYF